MSTFRDTQLSDFQRRAEDALTQVAELSNYLAGIGSIPDTPLSSFNDATLGLHTAQAALRHLVLQVAHWRQTESEEATRLERIRRGKQP